LLVASSEKFLLVDAFAGSVFVHLKKARSSWFIYQIFMIEEKWIRTLEAAFSHMVAIYFLQFWYDS